MRCLYTHWNTSVALGTDWFVKVGAAATKPQTTEFFAGTYGYYRFWINKGSHRALIIEVAAGVRRGLVKLYLPYGFIRHYEFTAVTLS